MGWTLKGQAFHFEPLGERWRGFSYWDGVDQSVGQPHLFDVILLFVREDLEVDRKADRVLKDLRARLWAFDYSEGPLVAIVLDREHLTMLAIADEDFALLVFVPNAPVLSQI